MLNKTDLFQRTEVRISPSPEKMYRNQVSLWMGSCFVDSISPFLQRFHYQALINPLGVVYHPLILQQLLLGNGEDIFSYSFEKEGVWLNYLLGTGFAAESEIQLNQLIANAKSETEKTLTNADWLVMTWGTAVIYLHDQCGPVGKCHKQPGTLFQKKTTSPQELTDDAWSPVFQSWKSAFPKLKILLTLSPVRHIRDGLEENSKSKASLRWAIEELKDQHPNVFYFPAYEMVLDEIRDYRYFEKDLIHPNKEAVDYIWNRFSQTFLNPEEVALNWKMEELALLKSHKPQAPFGKAFEMWKNKIEEKSEQVRAGLALERGKPGI
jgi:hypothetical protein